MKVLLRTLLVIILVSLSIRTSEAQGPIYLPIILSDGRQVMEYPILSISNGTDTINLLDPGSGLQMDNPYWQPNIAQLKQGGTFVNPANADGQALVSANYDNVIETIPLRIVGPEGYKTVENLRRMLQMSVNAQQYYTASFEQNQVYMAVKAKGDNFLTGYAAIYTISLPNISNPFGYPFVNNIDYNQFDTINLVLNREPFFSTELPGQYIGPYTNVLQNSDFYNWSNGFTNINPDLWTEDIAAANPITGQIDGDTDTKFNNGYSLKVSIDDSSAVTGKLYGVYQTLPTLEVGVTYTFVAWIKNNGITAGSAQILVSDALNPTESYEIYDSAVPDNDWTLYYITFTTEDLPGSIFRVVITNDTTDNVSGSILIDSMMLLNGDYTDDIENNILSWVSSSIVLNSYDSDRELVTNEDRLNYLDIWNVPGDILAKGKVSIENSSTVSGDGNPENKYVNILIGEKFKLDKGYIKSINDLGGPVSLDGNDDNLYTVALSDNWLNLGGFSINDDNTAVANKSKYKLILRLRDGSTSPLTVRAKYWITDQNKPVYLPEVDVTTKGKLISVDLTPDTFVDFSKQNSNFSNFGYSIDVKREDGSTDSVELDYVLHLPLDNYLKATIDNGLNPGSNLILSEDTIAPIISDSSHNWAIAGTLTEAPTPKQIYNNKLYFGILEFNSLIQVMVSYTNTIQVAYDFPGVPVYRRPIALAPYHGLLYTLYADTVNGSFLYSTDGTSFPGTLEDSFGQVAPFDSVVYDDKLWITYDPGIITWDGTAVANPASPPDTTGQILVYKNELYVTNTDNNNSNDIYRYDGPGVWTAIYSSALGLTTNKPRMAVYNDLLYIIDNVRVAGSKEPYIYTWDGGTLTNLNSDIPSVESGDGILYGDLHVYNGKLWIISKYNTNNGTYIYVSEDNGLTFILHSFLEDEFYLDADYPSSQPINWNGSMYITTENYLWSYSELDNVVGTIDDYEGEFFLFKNRSLYDYEYQRILSKLLRNENTDYLEDGAYIGIGYRPQYFSLINRDDF